jgi:hypothetical protein
VRYRSPGPRGANLRGGTPSLFVERSRELIEILRPIFEKKTTVKITEIPGIGPTYEQLLSHQDIRTVEDYLFATFLSRHFESLAAKTSISPKLLKKWRQQAQLLKKEEEKRDKIYQPLNPPFTSVRGYYVGGSNSSENVTIKIVCPFCKTSHISDAVAKRVSVMFSLGPSATPVLLLTLALIFVAMAFIFPSRRDSSLVSLLVVVCMAALYLYRELRMKLTASHAIKCTRLFLCPATNQLFEAQVKLPYRFSTLVRSVEIKRPPVK